MKIKQLVMLPILFTLIISLSLMMCVSKSSPEEYDVIIKNTKIVDGTGTAFYMGDIAIKGEKIATIGKIRNEAPTVIDGTGLITCPGFIDPHSHADWNIIQRPLAENLIMQGITSIVAGNCGESEAPDEDITFDAWMSKVEETEISTNLAMLIGHDNIRWLVMGEDWKREATDQEIEEMRVYVEDAMRGGAFGLSAAIDAPWLGYFASIKEKVELAKIVAKYGGFYVPHTRHIRAHWPTQNLDEYSYVLYYGPLEDIWVGTYRGYIEAIEVARQSGVSLHIAHLCPAYHFPQPHPEFLDDTAVKATLAEIIDKAREEGIDITFDVNHIGIQGKSPLIREFLTDRFSYPEWLSRLDKDIFIEKLETQEFRAKIREMYDGGRIKFNMVHTKVDPYWMDLFKILDCKKKDYVGKTIGEIAQMKNIDPLEVIFDMLVEDPDTTWVQHINRRKAGISMMFKSPVSMPCTDTSSIPGKLPSGAKSLPGPGAYGLFADYFGTYVRDKALLTLEEAVWKATGFPAQRFGLVNRGNIKTGAYADIVVFDIDTIKIRGDYDNPAQPPEGIHYVLVNGKIVYKDMAHTGEKPGKLIRHKY